MGFVTKSAEHEVQVVPVARSRAKSATVSGPFEWVAVKSKYFVTAVLAFDSTGAAPVGGLSVRAIAAAEPRSGRPRPTSGSASRSRRAATSATAVRRADGVRPAGHGRPRLRRRESLRLARLPDDHPPGGGGGALAAGLDARAPAPGLRPGAGAASASWCGSCSGRSTRRRCAPTCSCRRCSR